MQLPADVFDDPFEPPPQVRGTQEQPWLTRGCSVGADTCSETCSTSARSLMDCFEKLHSGASSSMASGLPSGAVTPARAASIVEKGYTLMPMWFSVLPSEPQFSVIPHGIVQSIRAQFEPSPCQE